MSYTSTHELQQRAVTRSDDQYDENGYLVTGGIIGHACGEPYCNMQGNKDRKGWKLYFNLKKYEANRQIRALALIAWTD